MKDNISKANYIPAAYDILSRDGVPAVTIRRLAEELRCNSANLYRYFDGLDELIIYASLKYLKSYINEVQQIYVTIETTWSCIFLSGSVFPAIPSPTRKSSTISSGGNTVRTSTVSFRTITPFSLTSWPASTPICRTFSAAATSTTGTI